MPVEIYTTDTDSGQVSVVRQDQAGEYQVVTKIPVGNAPRGSVKFTKDGRGFVSNTSTNTISEIDALTHREVARIVVGAGPRGLGIVPGERYMLVSNSGSNTVSVVDLETRQELFQIAVGRDPRHMGITADGRFAYVCIWGSGYIAKLDLVGLQDGSPQQVREVARIKLDQGSFPYSLNFDRTGTRAYVACNAIAAMPVIDLETDAVIANVPVSSDGGRAVAFTEDNRYALLTLERESVVAVVDTESLQVTRYIPVGPAPRGVTVNEETMYSVAFSRAMSVTPGAPQFGPHTVTVVQLDSVDLATAEGTPNTSEVRVGYGPCSVSVFDPDKISYNADRLNAATVRLVEGTTVPA